MRKGQGEPRSTAGRHTIATSALWAAAMLWLASLIGGCGTERPVPPSATHDLSRVPLSRELAGPVAEGLAALRTPGSANPHTADLDRFLGLIERIQQPDSLAAAADELFALWRAEPSHFLWIEIATSYDFLLHREVESETLFALPELADSTSAVGGYVHGRRFFYFGSRGRHYRAAGEHLAELDSLQQCWLILKLAWSDAQEGLSLPAARQLLDWLPRARATGGVRLELFFWYYIARHLSDADRQDDALHAAAVAEAMALEAGYRHQVLRTRLIIARIMERRREVDGARVYLSDCTDTAIETGMPLLANRALNQAAALCIEQNDPLNALELDKRGIAYGMAQRDSINTPRAMMNVALDFRLLGELDSCRVYNERAGRWIDAYPDPENVAFYPFRLAPYHLLIGDYARAESLLAVAHERGASAGTHREEAEILLDIIRQGLELGRPEAAYRAIDRLRDLRPVLTDELADQNPLADFELASADLLAAQGDFRASSEALDRARDAIRRGGGEGRLWNYHRSRGELARLREDPPRAEESFRRCLEVAADERNPDHLSSGRVLLGRVLLDRERYAEALALFGDPQTDPDFGARFRARLSARLLTAQALAHQGLHREALVIYEATRAQCTVHSPLDLLVRLDIETGRSLAALERWTEAETRLLAARDLSRRSLPTRRTPELVAFGQLERRELAEVLIGLYLDRPQLLPDGDPAPPTLLLAEECRRADTPFGEPDLHRVLADLDRNPGSAVLVFLVGAERSFQWAVSAAGVVVRRLPGRSDLREHLLPVVMDLEEPGRPSDPAALSRLSELLLGSLTDRWRPDRLLRIVPDGVLEAVPWAALPWPSGAKSEPWSPTTGGRIVDFGPVVEYPGLPAGTARSLPSTTSGPVRLLAVGCDSGGEGLPDLRHAEVEARRIAELWPVSDARLLLGEAAADLDLSAPAWRECDVIHLASHAVVRQGLPGRSTLRLTGGAAGPGGPLSVAGIGELELEAELIYLSCCEAARRLSVGGGGLSDFTGAFLRAGVASVVASNIRVDDEAAGHLAESFYRHWLAGSSKAEALRAAQRDVAGRPEWSHPYYWAFFRLVGHPD